MKELSFRNLNERRIAAKNALPCLTPIELHIIELMKYDMHINTMSDILNLPKRLVKRIRRNIFAKTGCCDLEELLLYTEVYLMATKGNSQRQR